MAGMIKELLRGLGTTLRSATEKPVTIQYPEVKRPVSARFKGRADKKEQQKPAAIIRRYLK